MADEDDDEDGDGRLEAAGAVAEGGCCLFEAVGSLSLVLILVVPLVAR